jgi:hypothetical protein
LATHGFGELITKLVQGGAGRAGPADSNAGVAQKVLLGQRGCSTQVDEQIARLERMVFEGLQGSTAGLRLVIDQSLINEFIAEHVTPRYPALTDLQLAIAADNQIAVRVRSKALLVPDLTLYLEIDRVVTLDPLAVRFRIRKQGLSQAVAWALPAMAHTLPPYVKLSGQDVVVELATLLEQWRSMLPLLENLEIQTAPRKLHVAVDLRASSRMKP